MGTEKIHAYFIITKKDGTEVRWERPRDCKCTGDDHVWAIVMHMKIDPLIDSGEFINYRFYRNGIMEIDYNEFKAKTLSEFGLT